MLKVNTHVLSYLLLLTFSFNSNTLDTLDCHVIFFSRSNKLKLTVMNRKFATLVITTHPQTESEDLVVSDTYPALATQVTSSETCSS